MLDLGIPLPLKHILNSMMKINDQSLLVFTNVDFSFETYETDYEETYGIEASIVDKKAMDMIALLCILAFYFLIGPALLKYVPDGKLQKWWQQKFILKKYATCANVILCFAPSLLLSAVLNFGLQKSFSSIATSAGIGLLVSVASGIFVFAHALILLNTQFSEEHKTEECYLGASSL